MRSRTDADSGRVGRSGAAELADARRARDGGRGAADVVDPTPLVLTRRPTRRRRAATRGAGRRRSARRSRRTRSTRRRRSPSTRPRPSPAGCATARTRIGAALPGVAPARSGWLATDAGQHRRRDPAARPGHRPARPRRRRLRHLDGNIGGFVDTTLAVDVDLGDAGTMPAIVTSPPASCSSADERGRADGRRRAHPGRARHHAPRARGHARRSVVLATPALGVPDLRSPGRWPRWRRRSPTCGSCRCRRWPARPTRCVVEGQPQTISAAARSPARTSPSASNASS